MVPLSYAQSRLWFLDRFEGGVATYNMPTAFRISGALDVEALTAAVDDVIARHEALRTIFPDMDGVPFQQVLPAEAGMWRRGDAAVVSLTEQDLLGELVELAGYRFDLATEIPIRAQIYEVGPEQHVVGIVVHHIAFDGWSLAPMARDIGEAYLARRGGPGPAMGAVAGAVRRLHALATGLVGRRVRSRQCDCRAAGLLAAGVGRFARGGVAADGSGAPAGAQLPRRCGGHAPRPAAVGGDQGVGGGA
jgi:hypothetical protein